MRPKRCPSPLLQKVAFIVVLTFFLYSLTGYGQPVAGSNHLIDSLKGNLSRATTDEEKNYWMLQLADYYFPIDADVSEKYAQQAMQVAELGRNRRTIIRTYLSNGQRFLSKAQLSNSIQQAKANFEEARKMAQQNGLDDELAYSYASLSKVARGVGDYDKALNYNNLALSIAGAGNNDSLKVIVNTSMGITYMAKNEKLLAFRNFLEVLDIAEASKKEYLLTTAYSKMAGFYSGIEDYDKAIDYSMKTLQVDQRNRERDKLIIDYVTVGQLFVAKKQYDVALKMYENAISQADSMGVNAYKITPYLYITNMYFDNDQLAKGLEYMNGHQALLDFFKTNHLGCFLDAGYGSIYSAMGKYDSAAYFFKKAEPEIEQHTNKFVQNNFYMQVGRYNKKKGDYPQAIVYFLKAQQVAEAIKDLNMLQTSAQYLDSMYTLAGDYKNAWHYNQNYNLYKDSIKALAKETDMLKLEVDNDNKRRDRLAKEEEENVQRRHNVQYMGITAGIASLFVAMVMMGFFVVSPRTIRALGFFSFIFLFEFVILLADKQIHEWTHGEPWKILFIKIGLAAILLPLHHWMEHKVIHYLTTRKKLSSQHFLALGRLIKGKKETHSPQV